MAKTATSTKQISQGGFLLALLTIGSLFRPVEGRREIVFPPISPVPPPRQAQAQQNINGDVKYRQHVNQQQHRMSPQSLYPDDPQYGDDPLFWSEVVYRGLNTYANLPWAHCLSGMNVTDVMPPARANDGGKKKKDGKDGKDDDEDLDISYDIAIVGAPFDTATTGRPGARFGPAGIRRGSRRILPHGSWDTYTHTNTLLSWAKIVDCGDAPLTFLDNTIALQQLETAHTILASRKAYSAHSPKRGSVPRTIVLGGDHTTTLAALRVARNHWGPITVVHFDSHIDTWDPSVLGGGFSHYAGVNHGTFLHIAHEEGLLHNDTNLHVGTRAPVSNKRYDWSNDRHCGFDIVTARDIDKIGISGVVDRIRSRVGGTNVYISVDIDVLDPAHAPGTGTAEVGGWTTRELLSVLDGLEGLNVIGGDVVEVAPVYDNAGETTVLAAAEVVHSLISLMVVQPVKALVDLE